MNPFLSYLKGLRDAILAAHGYLTGIEVIVAAHEFEFIGGSLGTAAGTTLVMAFQRAGELRCPIVVFACSGGARLQEGIFSLMQMPRVTAALQRFREHSLPYVVVLANPSSGGVAASYGMLGDVTIAEPGARIGFAGQRVIEGTIRQQLPPGFQTAEFLLKYGMVDMIVDRRQMRSSISRVLRLLMKLPVS